MQSLPCCSWSCPQPPLHGQPTPSGLCSWSRDAEGTNAALQLLCIPWKCRAHVLPRAWVPLLSRQAQVQPSCQPCFPWHSEMLCSQLACRVTCHCPGWGQPQGHRLGWLCTPCSRQGTQTFPDIPRHSQPLLPLQAPAHPQGFEAPSPVCKLTPVPAPLSLWGGDGGAAPHPVPFPRLRWRLQHPKLGLQTQGQSWEAGVAQQGSPAACQHQCSLSPEPLADVTLQEGWLQPLSHTGNSLTHGEWAPGASWAGAAPAQPQQEPGLVSPGLVSPGLLSPVLQPLCQGQEQLL